MPPSVLTTGHSNHPLDRFLALLAQHGVEALVDIRRFPGSRKHPHFHRGNLAVVLPKSGVEYHWLEPLGSCRASGQVFWPGEPEVAVFRLPSRQRRFSASRSLIASVGSLVSAGLLAKPCRSC